MSHAFAPFMRPIVWLRKAEHTEPSLEALFFVNALQKGRKMPLIEITPKEQSIDLPDVVMESKG